MTALLPSAITVGGWTLVSRFAGLVRDVLLAAILGTGPWAEAFVVALRVPNLFRRLVAEGAFAAAFVPVLSEAASRGRGRRFAEEILSGGLVLLLFVTTLAEIFMPVWVRLVAGGFSQETFALTVPMAQITFPYLISMFVVAVYGGIASTRGRFWAEAAGPIILNVCLITALCCVALFEVLPGPGLAWGVSGAGLLQGALLVRVCGRLGISLRVRRPRRTKESGMFLRVFGPACVVGLLPPLTVLVSTRIASAREGAVSVLYYAERLYQLPLGVIGVALGVVLLPRVSRALAEGAQSLVQASQNRAVEYALLLTVPAAVGLGVLSEIIVGSVFEYGAFSPEATRVTARACSAFAVGLPAFVLVRLLSVIFFARREAGTPVAAAAAGACVNVGLAFVLFEPLGVWGLALATSVGGWLQACVLFVLAVRGGLWRPDRRLVRLVPRVAAAVVVMGVFLSLLTPPEVPSSLLMRGVLLGALVIGGAGVYACGLLGAFSWRQLGQELWGRESS